MVRAVFDMETRDPDDVLALCLLAAHPAVALVAVTVNPGTPAQIAIVRALLGRLGVDIPVGARHPASTAAAVSRFHVDWLGVLPGAAPDGDAVEILAGALTPATALLTGAPLHALRRLLRERPEVTISRWVAQGAFAGDSLVAPPDRLAKFAGRETCESHNFGVDAKAALAALASDRIGRRELVGKNVTHGVTWDRALHARLTETTGLTAGAGLAVEAMSVYLADHPEGKYLHDPLAACALFDPGAFTWAEVEVYSERGAWGARRRDGTGTFLAVAVDRARALRGLFAPARLTLEARA
jgi:pyrimidine-specific ribonucleoside hydrolase